MAQINVTNLTFYYEGSFDNIFEDVSFSIDTDWKLGFIGRNGKGKTTFLNLLLGKQEYIGTIHTSTIFDYFPYKVTKNNMDIPVVDFMDEWKVNCEQWRVICELDKLGMDAEILYCPFGTLSHGERTKVMLAVLFSGENDFLLIDEPTNHLDWASREVIKKYLGEKKGFILVSHDRELLDACIDHVLVLNRESIEVQAGNFSSWWEDKSKKDTFSKRENEKHLKEIAKLKQASDRTVRWADKNENTKIGFNPKREPDRMMNARAYIGTKTKKMQSRANSYEMRMSREIEEKEGLLKDIENPVELKMMPLTHHKKTLISAKEYGLRYVNTDRWLLDNFSFQINSGERIFINGANGCGKSTFIQAILGHSIHKDLEENKLVQGSLQEQGQLETATGLVISYINQDTSFLKGSIKDFCKEWGLDESLFCTLLRQLGMERVQFEKNMEVYSEGQKKKTLIAASLMTPAHLYIWDEPLNYIDVFSRMQIEKLLLIYQPTMLIVEHDAIFREQIATKIIDM